MIADPAQIAAPSVRSNDVPSLEFLLRRFDRGGLPRPTFIWNPVAGDLPDPALRIVRTRWSEARATGRTTRVEAPVPPCGDIVFIDPSFRLVGYPRQSGSQIVAVGEGYGGTGAMDVVDLPIEVDLLRVVYAIVASSGGGVLISMARPTMRAAMIVDRLVLPTGRHGVMVALSPRH